MHPSLAALVHHTKGFLRGTPFRGVLESPGANAAVANVLFVSGWMFSPGDRIVRLDATLASKTLPPPIYGIDRADVARIFPNAPEARACGFQSRITLDPALSGPLALTITAADSSGRQWSLTRTIHVRPGSARSLRVPAGIPEDDGPLASVSIVIPVHGGWRHTEACLRCLHTTLPERASIEIIVVDDGSPDETAAMLARQQAVESRLVVLTNERNVGFGASCNRGAGTARHDVLVFLNNDTLPEPGWLPPLIAPLRAPDVGAVGAKLVYPGGMLQEAGGVIFSDASGWNFGNGNDPDDPLFNYVREVDYCSAAALATPRRLFLDLHGFDPRFAPAYYEDTDYCFTLRTRGFKTLYQPASVVVHVEGGTAGVDEQSGVKRAQAANRLQFADKWRRHLGDQPAPLPEPDRGALHRVAVRGTSTRRALVCAPTLPEWDRESGSKRVFDLMTFLREGGWAVTFVADSLDGPDSARYITALQQMGVAVHGAIDEDLIVHGRFDLALLHFWWIGEQYAEMIRRVSPATRIVVDSVDLHFVRESRNPQRLPGREHETRRELETYAQADAVLTVSQREAGVLMEAFGALDHAHVVPDAEMLERSMVPFEERRGLLFLGNFRHQPNVAALAYLMQSIVPLLPRELLERHPITVVGTDLTDAVIEQTGARRDGVNLVGWVPSIEPYLAGARLMIVPLTYGAGTKRKLVQAAMSGLPAVSTSVGTEGLPLTHGQQVLIADDATAFAAAVVRLVDDPMLWERLAGRAREAIQTAHSREAVRRRFNDVIEWLLT